jgi:hypothetical protein
VWIFAFGWPADKCESHSASRQIGRERIRLRAQPTPRRVRTAAAWWPDRRRPTSAAAAIAERVEPQPPEWPDRRDGPDLGFTRSQLGGESPNRSLPSRQLFGLPLDHSISPRQFFLNVHDSCARMRKQINSYAGRFAGPTQDLEKRKTRFTREIGCQEAAIVLEFQIEGWTRQWTVPGYVDEQGQRMGEGKRPI